MKQQSEHGRGGLICEFSPQHCPLECRQTDRQTLSLSECPQIIRQYWRQDKAERRGPSQMTYYHST